VKIKKTRLFFYSTRWPTPPDWYPDVGTTLGRPRAREHPSARARARDDGFELAKRELDEDVFD
jgi:hypothetical protein